MKGLLQEYNEIKTTIDQLTEKRRELKREMEKRVKSHLLDVYAVPGIDMEDFWVRGDEIELVLNDGIRVTYQDRSCRRGVVCFKSNDWLVYIDVDSDGDDILWQETVSKDQRDWIMEHKKRLFKSCCSVKEEWYDYTDHRAEYINENF